MPEEPSEGTGRVSKGACFAIAALSAFMSTLDSSIVNVALPTLANAFGADLKAVAWVVQSYLLVTMAFLLIGGRLLDLFGARLTFVLGFLIFTAGSALCAFSSALAGLILARAFQGLGAAILMGANQGLIARSFPAQQRGRALGMVGTVVAVGLASGPPLGGFLISSLGWRSIFYINIPVGVLALVYTWIRFEGKAKDGPRESFDWAGAVLIVTGLSCLFLGLDHGVESGWAHNLTLLFISLSLAALVLFLINEQRAAHPLVPLSLFGIRFFTQSCAASFLSFFAMISAVILLPFYLQNLRSYSPSEVGLFMMTLPASMMLLSPLAGWLSDRIGTRIPTTLGLGVVGLGLWRLASLGPDTPTLEILLGLALVGVGKGIFGSPNSSGLISAVPSRNVGTASGLSALMRTSGIAFGIAFSVTVFSLYQKEDALEGFSGVYGLEGMRHVFLFMVCVAALNMINSATRGKEPARGNRGCRGGKAINRE